MGSRVKSRPAISVRPLEIEDLPKIQEIDQKTTGRYRAFTYDDPQRNCLGGDLAISFVAEIDGEVVGFIFGWLVDALWAYHQGARLEMIGVDPEHRREGVGRALLAAFLRGCEEKGAHEVHLLVHLHDRELKAFLSKSRFQQGQLVDYEYHFGREQGTGERG